MLEDKLGLEALSLSCFSTSDGRRADQLSESPLNHVMIDNVPVRDLAPPGKPALALLLLLTEVALVVISCLLIFLCPFL